MEHLLMRSSTMMPSSTGCRFKDEQERQGARWMGGDKAPLRLLYIKRSISGLTVCSDPVKLTQAICFSCMGTSSMQGVPERCSENCSAARAIVQVTTCQESDHESLNESDRVDTKEHRRG